MSSRANIYMDRGTDFRVSLDLFDSVDEELGIATYNFFGSLRKVYSTRKLADFTIEKGDSIITLVLTDQETLALKPGKYQYDVIMQKTTGELSKIVEGLAIVADTMTEVT
jgi:hypothetical protein